MLQKELTQLNYFQAKKIGILGGGQLARMLCLKGHELGLQIKVLSDSADDPAAQVTSLWQQGSYHNELDLKKFLATVDLVTFESEFINCKMIKKTLESVPFSEHHFFPSLDAMASFQDRWLQKNLFKEYKLPTSEFYNIESLLDISRWGNHFNFRYVLKKRFGGYDGYGTFISRNQMDHHRLLTSLEKTADFQFIMEKFITFKNELACQFFRNRDGRFFHLPLVQSHQTNSKCDWIAGPQSHPQFNLMVKKIKSLMVHLNYVGTLTFEFFNVGKELLINESAPRVHNSGHYSLDYPPGDQFTLHLKSILNLELPKKNLGFSNYSFVMTNLIGSHNRPAVIPNSLTGKLYWYGKKENRVGRKMGHVNYIDLFSEENTKKLLKTGIKERKKIKI